METASATSASRLAEKRSDSKPHPGFTKAPSRELRLMAPAATTKESPESTRYGTTWKLMAPEVRIIIVSAATISQKVGVRAASPALQWKPSPSNGLSVE